MPFERELQRHSEFLKTFQGASASDVRKKLHSASDVEINILLKVLHSVTVGQIPIKSEDLAMLVKKRRVPTLRKYFEEKENYFALRHQSRREKVNVLFKLQTVIPILLKQLM